MLIGLKKMIKSDERALKKEMIEVTFLFNIKLICTHTELTITHNVREAIERLPPEDVLLADSEFFTKKGCELILAKGDKTSYKSRPKTRRWLVIRLLQKSA